MLALLAFVAPETLGLGELTAPRPLPVLAIAALQLGLGLRQRQAWRCLIGACCLIAAAMIALPDQRGTSLRGPVAFHLVLLAVLGLGAAFDDALGRVLRSVGAGLVLLGSAVVMTTRLDPSRSIPSWAVTTYPLVLSALLAGYGVWLRHRTSLLASSLLLTSWLAAFAWRGYALLRQRITGLDFIAVGMLLFALAVLTSMAKGGLMPGRLVRPGEKAAPGPSD